MTCREKVVAVLLLVCLIYLCGCNLPGPATPPLTAAAVQHTLDQWNPQYCKVVEFYGLHQPEGSHTRLAFVHIITNPKDPTAKPVLSVAQFQLLTRPDGRQEWFLTSLLSHSAGLTRRQGWDNLLVAVKAKE